RVDADDERTGGHAGERVVDAPAIATDVVRVHGLDESDVGVRVEAARELVAVEVEVRLDGEAPAVSEGAEARLPGSLEARVEFDDAPIVEHRHAACEGEPAVRTLARSGLVEVAAREARIDLDRLELG